MGSTTQESEHERRLEKRAKALYRVADGGLEEAFHRNGHSLLGFSAKMTGDDVLLTIRARTGDSQVVAHVGGETLAACLVKAWRLTWKEELRWKADKYAASNG